MSAAEQLREVVDWIKPDLMAELIGTTVKAMNRKRQRGTWPAGLVWDKIQGEIVYSITGYNAWINQNRAFRQAFELVEIPLKSTSCGAANDSTSPGRSRRHRRISMLPDAFVLK